MSTQLGDTIFASQGETIDFNIPVYNSSGVLATDVSSAKLAYFGGDMIEPEIANCTVVAGGTITYSIPQGDTLLLTPELYTYEVKMKKTTSAVEQPVEVGFIVLRSSMITTAL